MTYARGDHECVVGHFVGAALAFSVAKHYFPSADVDVRHFPKQHFRICLPFQYASQRLLKLWLFVHIPLTYSLLVWTVAHIVLVFAYSGGAR